MPKIVDLHIHSHYSRATSKQLNIADIARYAAIKGVDIIATGDITHPGWLKEIEEQVEEDGTGFLRLTNATNPTRLALCGEISNIYKKNGVTRRLHTVICVSSLAATHRLQKILSDRGFNITSDGRPILGCDVQELAKIALEADERALIIPGHIWTPWFSMFGSKSGFNSMEECWGEMRPYIYAIETGLSSDPAMNWRVSNLNNVTILSNSDAHSPQKIGREANVFDWGEQTPTYELLYNSIKNRKNLKFTIEFYPEEGKYHFDGHKKCGVVFDPATTAKHKGICPRCGLKLVVGVMNRVEQLADQKAADSSNQKIPFKNIIPLPEVIAEAFAMGPASKKVQKEYNKLISALGGEFHILLDAPLESIRAAATPIVATAIERTRTGNVHISPGYDGVYGKINIFTPDERAQLEPQQSQLL